MRTSPPDGGVANERTALAWERTALAVICGAAVVSRLTHGRLGAVALVCLGVSVPLGLMLLAAGRARYLRHGSEAARSGLRDGRAPAAVAGATLALALVEGAALLR